MKFNWKMLVAAVLIVIVSVWAIDSLRPRSYTGTDLSFAVGRGSVTLNNRSEAALPIQLTGVGSRIFTVSSDDEALRGASTRQGTGRTVSQLFDLTVPVGVSVFTIVNGSNVNLVASSTTLLEATVQSLSGSESTTTLLITLVVILAAAFYIFRASGRDLGSLLRREPAPVLKPVVAPVGDNGRPMRSYGDNRADITEKN